MSEIKVGDYVRFIGTRLVGKVADNLPYGIVTLESGGTVLRCELRKVARLRVRTIKYKPAKHGEAPLSNTCFLLPTGDDTTYWPGR